MPAAEAHVDARRLRRAAGLAAVADGMTAVALPLLAAELTNDPLAVAAVVALQHLPWVLARLAVPVLARRDVRTVVGAADAARAIAVGWLGLLVLGGAETLAVLQVTALIVGLGEALTEDAEQLAAADGGTLTAVTSRGLSGVALVGLPLGGLLYEVFPATPLVVNVLLYSTAGLLVLLIRTAAGRPPGRPAGAAIRPPAGAGRATAVAALTSAAGGSVLGILVLFAVRDLGLGAPAFGLLLAGLAVAAGLGAVAATEIGRVAGVRAGLALSLLSGAAGYGAAAGLADPDLPVLAALGLGAGAAGATAAAVLVRTVVVSRPTGRTTEGLRGFHTLVWSALVAGTLAGGALAGSRSVPDSVWAAAGLLVVAGAVALTVRPREIG